MWSIWIQPDASNVETITLVFTPRVVTWLAGAKSMCQYWPFVVTLGIGIRDGMRVILLGGTLALVS